MLNRLNVSSFYKPFGIIYSHIGKQSWNICQWLKENQRGNFSILNPLAPEISGVQLIEENDRLNIPTSNEASLNAGETSPSKREHHFNYTYLFISKDSKANITTLNNQKVKPKTNYFEALRLKSPRQEEPIFKSILTSEGFSVWQLETEQNSLVDICLHAHSTGYTILGDKINKGYQFYRLCLHLFKVRDQNSFQEWTAEIPPQFTDLSLIKDQKLCALTEAWHQRNQFIINKLIPEATIRLSHYECPSIRIDQFGDQLWIYNYEPEFSSIHLFPEFLKLTSNFPTWVREMRNRGSEPNKSNLIPLNQPKQRWNATENNLLYELRSDQGLSPGLFLDQRENRQWVQLNSQNKRVLNLFSYTCGFSLNAAKGGATEVVSVDVSQSFLNWGKTNFQLNGFDPNQFEFWSTDSIEFIKRTQKKNRKFDLIICDPPSFGRSKNGVFKIERDFSLLANLIFSLLAPKGKMLLSSNYEIWSQKDFEIQATKLLPNLDYRICPRPIPGIDFYEIGTAILKCLIIEKNISNE